MVVVRGFVRRGVMEKKGIPDKDGYCPRAANFLPAVPSIDFFEKGNVSCIAMASRIINAVGLAMVKIDYRFTNKD